MKGTFVNLTNFGEIALAICVQFGVVTVTNIRRLKVAAAQIPSTPISM
jgi:hypothetical protein